MNKIMLLNENSLYAENNTLAYNKLLQISALDEVNISEAVQVNINNYKIPRGSIPLYVILAGGDGFFSKVIGKVTNSIYSHACVTMWDMDEFYSFNDVDSDGFSIESIQKFREWGDISHIKIMSVFASKNIMMDMIHFINHIKKNKSMYKYNDADFFMFPFKKEYDFDNKNKSYFYCSEFVLWFLKNSIATGLRVLPNKHLSPGGIENVLNDYNAVTLYEGSLADFKESTIVDFEKRNGVYDYKQSYMKKYNHK